MLPMCNAQYYWPEPQGDGGARENRLPAAVAELTHTGLEALASTDPPGRTEPTLSAFLGMETRGAPGTP